MERKEFNIIGTVRTTPIEMNIDVDVTGMDFGSPGAGKVSEIVSRIMTITGNLGAVNVGIGTTDWLAEGKLMPGGITEVSVDAGEFKPVIVAEEVALGSFGAGTYTLNFRLTPPIDVDLNTYEQTIVVIGK